MSEILPHLIKDGRGTLDVYFTRVSILFGLIQIVFSWIEMLSNKASVGCHIALTPTWNETAFCRLCFAMGHASERHDINSPQTQAGIWIAFRQPVMREKARRDGKKLNLPEVNSEVWEEDEFWIELSWRIDKKGLGIKELFKSI